MHSILSIDRLPYRTLGNCVHHINTYREHTELFIDGDVLHSREGPTQGDPLAILVHMYTLTTVPLIKHLDQREDQVWNADDATGVGKVADL